MIKNNNKLIISDNCIFTDNFRLRGNGEIITNLTLPENAFNRTLNVEINNRNELNNLLKNNGIVYNDENFDTYIIKLNEGNYTKLNSFVSFSGNNHTIIINGNNQSLNPVSFVNTCNNTLNNVNLTTLNVGGDGSHANIPTTTLTLNQVNLFNTTIIYPNGNLTLSNSTVYSNIDNRGTLIIEDNVIFDSNINLTSTGTLLTNNTNLLYPFKDSFEGGILKDIIINKDIVTNGNFTLKNVTVDKTITNNGRLIIDDDVIFTENGQIAGLGEIVTNNITKLLPYIQTIHGNFTITDTTLNKTYYFMGNISLDKCNITSTDNINYGILNIIDSNIIVDDEATWITNYGLLVIDNSNTSGNITNNKEIYIDNLPEDYTYNNTYHVITNATALLYFDSNNGNILNDNIQEGDTLDFQGTISGIPGLTSLVINKPINIITSTNDGRIERFSSITYNNGASGSNITGLYTYNTQFYVRNAQNIVFDNISNVVNSSAIGWGVGQTSIGHNSTNITVKNSYFYTKDNGGSSTFVFNWADNSTLINSTVEADGTVGNLVYLTTYNVDIPTGVKPNSNNQILNNTIRGPSQATGICWGIVLSGINNIIDGNTINYTGIGITGQWGSGVTGNINDEQSLIDIYGNTASNNKLYGGCGISNVQGTIYNNYVEKGGIFANNSRVYNNTAAGLTIGTGEIIVTNNTITGTTTVQNSERNTVTIENNILKNIQINGNNTIFKNNNITSIANDMITSNTTFINNNIKDTITLAQRSLDFTFIENNITGKINLQCNNSIWTNNNITGNINIGTIEGNNNQFNTNNITGNIYLNSSWYATGNSFINNNIEGYIHIITIEGTNNTTIKNNTIITDQPYTITQTKPVTHALDVSNYTITDNYLKANGTYGDNSVNISRELNTVENNIPKIQITINDINTQLGQEINITARINLENQTITNITAGKITFKVNGKTLKDANGKVIYAKVVNGTATIENYEVPQDWTKEGTTIEAVYSGSTQCEKLTSEKTNITVAKAVPTLTTESINTTAGSTITLTATITDNDKTINTGKIVFKINGKTVKDTNGKVIYAKIVNNTVSVDYTIPESMKAGNYTITATYVGSDYDKLEAETTLTVAN